MTDEEDPKKRNADLTEFQEGTTNEGASDEAKTKESLRRWIERNGTEVQKPSKPNDELIVDDGKKRYLVVVQTATSPSKVREAVVRTHNVWKATTRTNTEEKPDAVLIATENSREGRLFDDDTKEIERDGWDGWRSRAVGKEQLPESEYVATDCTVRLLWEFAKSHDPETEVGIGALLSSALDGDSPPKPRALYKTSSNHNGNFAQNWCSIPVYRDYD